jgi:hypothetical protein
MTAPTSAVQTLQKILANVGPSTHDPQHPCVLPDAIQATHKSG